MPLRGEAALVDGGNVEVLFVEPGRELRSEGRAEGKIDGRRGEKVVNFLR